MPYYTSFRMAYHCSNTVAILVFIIPMSPSSNSCASIWHIWISFFEIVVKKQCPQYVHILLFHLKFCRFDSKKEIYPTQKIFSADNINELIFNLLFIMISIFVSTYNIFPSSAIHWTFTSHYRFCYFLTGEHSKKLTGNVLQYNARHKNTYLFVF